MVGEGRKSLRMVPSSSLWDKHGRDEKPIRTKEGNPGSILCWEDEATAGGKKAERLESGCWRRWGALKMT